MEPAVEATLAEFRRFRDEGPTPEELADARQLLTGSMPLRLETSDGVANLLLTIQRFGLGLDEVAAFIASINAVTADDVTAAVRRHLDVERVVVSSAGPEE